jgi:ribosome-interacting GTPase 1
MNIIRIYTKEPHKPSTNIPIILPSGASVKDAAESIRNGFSLQVKETRITGPSSKFSNQKVGLSHILKDKDIIEFHTK